MWGVGNSVGLSKRFYQGMNLEMGMVLMDGYAGPLNSQVLSALAELVTSSSCCQQLFSSGGTIVGGKMQKCDILWTPLDFGSFIQKIIGACFIPWVVCVSFSVSFRV